MLEMFMHCYRGRFSDPDAFALVVILVAGFGIIFFFSGLLAPLLVAFVLAYLLEWPTVRLQSIGCSRRWATSIVLVVFVGILLLMAFVVLPIAVAGGYCAGLFAGVANRAPAIYWLFPPLGDVDCIGGFRRYIATDGVRGTAYRLATGHLHNPRYAGDAQYAF